MSTWVDYPAIYEVNAWVWLEGMSRAAGKRITLGAVPDAELDLLTAFGVDALWLMGAWERSRIAREVALHRPGFADEYRRVLPDFAEEDVSGSPYAIRSYRVDTALGSDSEMAEFRQRLRARGVRLILDFVPNHLAIDHPWLADHPERLVQGDAVSLEREPGRFFRHGTDGQARVFAYGGDKYSNSWPDTVQVDYRVASARRAMIDTLLAIAGRCDGVRCDMAMLVMREEFEAAWGGTCDPHGVEFWPDAIKEAKTQYANFLMIAEAYWQREYDLQRMGFDFTYDKRLYDRLVEGNPYLVRDHLSRASLDFQRRLVRFIENHDEARAATKFGPERVPAIATLTFTVPGLRLIHDGQVEGRRQRVPVELGRWPAEATDPASEALHARLLAAIAHPVFRSGAWRLLDTREAWAGETSHQSIVACWWSLDDEYRLVVVNLSGGQSRGYVGLDVPPLAGHRWDLRDLLSEVTYARDGDSLQSAGLFLDLPGYRCHLFEIRQVEDVDPGLPGITRERTLTGPGQGIYTLAWSPDGKQLAAAGKEGVIWLWGLAQGDEGRQLCEHPGTVDCLAWAPDGTRLASGSRDRAVRLWDAHSGALLGNLEAHGDTVMGLAWSPDGTMLASASLDKRIVVWNVNPRQIKLVLDSHGDAINTIGWSPDGKTLATASSDRTIRLWDVDSWSLREALQHPDWISTIAWSANGTMLASGAGGGNITLWDATSGQALAICHGCGSHPEHQAARTARRKGRNTSLIAGPQWSLSANARNWTMCWPVSSFQREPQRLSRISKRLLQVASTLPLPSGRPSRRARA